MITLYIDTETSGLYRYDLPAADQRQPWIVSLAAELCDAAGNRIAYIETAIRANGRPVPEGARKVHGIDTAQAARGGVSELAALAILCGKESFVSQAGVIVGHGLEFDRSIIVASLARLGRPSEMIERPGRQFRDTMKAATPFCRLPHPAGTTGQFKWPTLDEACSILTSMPPREGHHNAADDIARTKALYLKLCDLGAFEEAA